MFLLRDNRLLQMRRRAIRSRLGRNDLRPLCRIIPRLLVRRAAPEKMFQMRSEDLLPSRLEKRRLSRGSVPKGLEVSPRRALVLRMLRKGGKMV
jgi:hypothetical protein